MSGRNRLRLGDPGYGPTCACGNRKHVANVRCSECHAVQLENSVYGISRTESIITFRNARTGGGPHRAL